MKYFSQITLIGSALAASLFIGCGSSTTTTTSSGTSGTAVDPYISQAKFYVVGSSTVGSDGLCGSKTAYISTATTSTGTYSFSETVPTDSIIKICQDYKGYHNGIAFDSNLSSKFNASNTANILSPATTLITNGMTATDIVSVLNDPNQDGNGSDGVGGNEYNLTVTDIYSDPMNGLSTAPMDTNATFTKIQATIAINMVMNMKSEFNMTSISDMNNSGYLASSINVLKKTLNTDNNGSGMTADKLALVGTSISDAIVSDIKLSLVTDQSGAGVDGNLTAALTAIPTLAGSLITQILTHPNKTFKLRKGTTWGASKVIETIPAGSDLNVTGRMMTINNDRNITFYTDSTYSELNTTSNLIQWGIYSLSDNNVSVSITEDNNTNSTAGSGKIWIFNGDIVKLNGGLDLNITDVNSSFSITTLTGISDLNGSKIILSSDTVQSRSFDKNGTYRQMESNNSISKGTWALATDGNYTATVNSVDTNISYINSTTFMISTGGTDTNRTKIIAESLMY